MNKCDIDVLTLCLEDELFCALYEGLCLLEKTLQTASPVDNWTEALKARQQLAASRRPDLLLQHLFADLRQNDAVVAEALLLWMLFTEECNTDATPLKDQLAKMLMAHGEAWKLVYEEFRKSETNNEKMGFCVGSADYRAKSIPAKEKPHDSGLVHDMVTCALETHTPDICRTLYSILSRIDYQKNYIYKDEVSRLWAGTNQIEAMAHMPHSIENRFEKDSCRFDAGSSMNGNVTYNYQHI